MVYRHKDLFFVHKLMGCLGSSADLDQAQLIVTGLAHVSLIKCRSGRQLCDVAGVSDVFGGPDGS